MALEPSSGRQSTSPTSSGRASPIARKWRHQLGGDESLHKDKAYRRYASGIERSLSLFDTALQEWADYISFLGRLLKSLQAHPSTIAAVPSKAIVAKRLAQCLNPTLPSGVHQKALEVYGYIFSMIGRDTLSQDLPLYLPGLSSTLSFASLSVRNPFLELLEKHIVELDARALRPALKAIILALLPGLEEETSEEFERTLKLLDEFKHAVSPPGSKDLGHNHSSGDEYFWQCFFLAAITSNGRRLGALAYLARNLPKLGHVARTTGSENLDAKASITQVAEIVTSPEPGLLIRCFAAGLADDQLLIQRGFLDLLVTHLPLHAPVLQNRVKSQDLELLITAAAGVVVRRDMSLNRRLWTWLLGPERTGVDNENGSESPVAGDSLGASPRSSTRYFEEFGLQPLTSAILKMIRRDSPNPVERARPFRICLSLMDRWEIGGLVVPDIFLPIVNSVREYKDSAATKADFSEVLRSASVFFDGVESGLIWGEIVGLIAQAVGPGKSPIPDRVDRLWLVNFIITHFNVREEEMVLIHAPLTVLTILAMLEETKEKTQEQALDTSTSDDVSRLALSIAMDLVDLIPQRALLSHPSTSHSRAKFEGDNVLSLSNAEVLQVIQTFYVQEQGNLEAFPPPFSGSDLSELLVREGSNVTCQSLSAPVSSAEAGLFSRLFVMLLTKAPKVRGIDTARLLTSVRNKLMATSRPPFLTFTSINSLAACLFSASYITEMELSGLVDPLVRLAWSYLSASQPKYHVEAVRSLWQLQTALGLSNHEIEASICSLITEHDLDASYIAQDMDPGRTFGILWTHSLQDNAGAFDRRASKASGGDVKGSSRANFEVMLTRPLFLLLNALLDERTHLFMTVRSWLQSLVGISKILQIIVAELSGFHFLRIAGDAGETAHSNDLQQYTAEDDLDQCTYYLRTISNILRWSPDSVWPALAQNNIPAVEANRDLSQTADHDDETSFLKFFVHVCLGAISGSQVQSDTSKEIRISQLHRTSLTALHQILLNPYASQLADLDLELTLIDRLVRSLNEPDPVIQVLLLDVVFAALKVRDVPQMIVPPTSPTVEQKRLISQDTSRGLRLSLTADRGDLSAPSLPAPPASLVSCLQAGFSAPSSRPVLDSWVSFLTECLPLYADTIFQILIPLVETFCSQIGQTFGHLQKTFKEPGLASEGSATPESTLISLLNGLEHVLARGHDRLLTDESKLPALKSPDEPQGFFGNMVSGVFASEKHQTRSSTANNRLTVLLTFQDAVRICFTIWSWGGKEGGSQDSESSASFNYTSLRMRNRARRLLEHLFAAEALECLETVVEVWQKSANGPNGSRSHIVFNLLHVLDGSRPKHTIPAIFNALYSRTNPGALDPVRKSTLTASLNDTDLVMFLVEYTRSLEDDAMDEIWADCMTFLKDLLANPFPHRQTLPSLLSFAAILGEKVDNTNFGEQRRMRRDLADLFLRLLTAIFTTRPYFSDNTFDNDENHNGASSRALTRPDDVVGILASIAPNLNKILVEQDRVLSASNTISTNVIGPTFKSKAFPDNVSKSTLVLLYQLTRLPNTQKSWRKDLGDAFNDPKFFGNSVSLVETDWLPLLRQWTLSDKERMPELLSRLQAPTTAGIVFGVGATSARLEADRKTQLNLRRVATLILATTDDNFVGDLPAIQEKIVDLLSATTISSPSSVTRADIYMVLRALVLKTSALHLATLWPIINAELDSALSAAVAPDHSQASDTYNNFSILQACKLLDTLLCIAPDDFQLQEWLFITDTIDAVYRQPQYHPVALADELSEELGATTLASATQTESAAMQASKSATRMPLLGPGGISDEGTWDRKDELVGKVLRPFFSQLSIFAFESTYSMGVPDWEACRSGLLKDLFDERSIVKAL